MDYIRNIDNMASDSSLNMLKRVDYMFGSIILSN